MKREWPAPEFLETSRLAHAKVNLGLAVTGRRSDGYHELASVFLRIGLADRLSGTLTNNIAGDQLVVDGDEACPVDGNIVLRAVDLLRTQRPLRAGGNPGLDLVLEKRIPIGAGLGGGSSDAASAISVAAELWWLNLKHTKAMELGAQLGADVPFFVEKLPTALVTGIGEQLEALKAVEGELGLVLVTPAERLATAAVFAELDRHPGASDSGHVIGELAAAFRSGLDAPALVGWAPRLRDANDLWPAAVRLLPGLERLRAELERALDRPFLLSGSGSTLFALYPSLGEARAAGEQLAPNERRELAGASVFAAGTDTDQDAWRIQ